MLTKKEYIQIIKNHMKNNKNKWFNNCSIVDGKTVQLKFYNKYIQAFYINGLATGSIEFKTQKEFINYIDVALN